jgi:predicted HTH transcriptional regulator
MSFSTKSSYQTTSKNNINNDQKNKRQSDILSFINQRKSAVIKDIAALFPDVSEKTIQRELGALVDAGKITKRGSKRWSIYLAVS